MKNIALKTVNSTGQLAIILQIPHIAETHILALITSIICIGRAQVVFGYEPRGFTFKHEYSRLNENSTKSASKYRGPSRSLTSRGNCLTHIESVHHKFWHYSALPLFQALRRCFFGNLSLSCFPYRSPRFWLVVTGCSLSLTFLCLLCFLMIPVIWMISLYCSILALSLCGKALPLLGTLATAKPKLKSLSRYYLNILFYSFFSLSLIISKSLNIYVNNIISLRPPLE